LTKEFFPLYSFPLTKAFELRGANKEIFLLLIKFVFEKIALCLRLANRPKVISFMNEAPVSEKRNEP